MRGALIAALLLFIAVPVSADEDNTCMDCAQRTDWRGSVKTIQAMCCMVTDDGYCHGGYFAVQPNVGWGCIVSPPDEYGNTTCNSMSVSNPCGDGGGSGGGGGGGIGGGGGDCSSSSGYCPPSCPSCSYTV